MCGIVGILGKGPVAPAIVEALRRLEYRGYDSAGVATLEERRIKRCRAEGKLANLADRLAKMPLSGSIGIGHTRWATHGAPTENNAHPHATDRVAVVHNGIIENFLPLKEELIAAGIGFQTETDTEVVAHLISREIQGGASPAESVRRVLGRLRGAFALAIMFDGEEDLMIAARHGPPLAVGIGEGEMFLGSDAIALAPFTNQIVYLEDGDWAVIRRAEVSIFDAAGEPVERPVQTSVASALLVDKGNHRHFMAKEIHEQPEVVSHTLSHYIDFANQTIDLPASANCDFTDLGRLAISACGTAYYAGLVAKYWFERHARLPVEIDVASEFRYREAPLDKGGLALMISQSGETADTLAVLRYCASQGLSVGAIVNVMESTIARQSQSVFPTLAGPEIGVASTKAFTCQLAVLACLAVVAGRQRGHIDRAREIELVTALSELPRHMTNVLHAEADIEELAAHLTKVRDVLYLGRGSSFPLALEGALKLKEISYLHAEGYAAGELKHGPIALIDEGVPVVVIAPKDQLFEKTVSNMEEVAARGGDIILFTDEAGAAEVSTKTLATIALPNVHPFIAPILHALPVQMLAYHTAVRMGTDVDQPRNLAKSVTVE